MQELETKAETDAGLQIVSSKTRIDVFWLLRVIVNYRIADINTKNRPSIRVVFKHATDIHIEKRGFLRVRGSKKTVQRSDLINHRIFINANKTRSDFAENSEFLFSDTNFRSEDRLKFSPTRFIDCSANSKYRSRIVKFTEKVSLGLNGNIFGEIKGKASAQTEFI